MQFFGCATAFWIWIFLVWTLNSSPKVCAYRWTTYQSLRQNQSDSSELETDKYDQEQNEVNPREPSENLHSLINLEHHHDPTIINSIKRIENHDENSEGYPLTWNLKREWLEGLTSGGEGYPSFQDFLERFSEVGVGFIFRDTVAAFLAKEREEQELSGSLAKVGVIAFALKTAGEYGSISGVVEKDVGLSLRRFSRYLGFGIFMIGTTKDYFTFFEDTQCLIHGHQAHAHDGGLRSHQDYPNVESSHFHSDSHSHHSHSQSHNNNIHSHEELQAQGSQEIPVISHSPEAQERNHVLLHSCGEKTEHELRILKSVASVAAAVFSYLYPEYAELLAFGEAGLEGLSYFYRQSQDGHLLKRMGLPGEFFNLESLQKFVQHHL